MQRTIRKRAPIATLDYAPSMRYYMSMDNSDTLIISAGRRGGNCDTVAAWLAEEGGDVVRLRDMSFSGCDGCGVCDSSGECRHRDCAAALYADIFSRKKVYIAAPCYFLGFDSHTKAFIDRAQYMWGKGKKSDTAVCLIAVGGRHGDDNFTGMERTLRCMCKVTGMKYGGGIFFGGADAVGEVRTDENREAVKAFAQGR